VGVFFNELLLLIINLMLFSCRYAMDDPASSRPFSIVPERAAAAAARKVRPVIEFM